MLFLLLIACAADPTRATADHTPDAPVDSTPEASDPADPTDPATDPPQAPEDEPAEDPVEEPIEEPVEEPPVDACAGDPTGVEIGECPPDFQLPDASGASWSLRAQAGSVIVLDFSAMWCPHCRNLAPELEALNDEYAADGLVVATVIHEDPQSNPPDAADLRAWTQAYAISHAVLGDDGAVEAIFGGFYQPNVLVIDRDHLVTYRGTGGGQADEIRDAIEAALR